LTIKEEEELASHLTSKALGMVKLTGQDVLNIICAAKENIIVKCYHHQSYVSQGFSAEIKKNLMYAHRLEEGCMIKLTQS